MISDLNPQRRTTSQVFTPNGVHMGIVKRVDTVALRVWVELPRLARGVEFGPLNTITTVSPRVGDTVACMFMENSAEDLIILGIVNDRWNVSRTSTSTGPPIAPREGDLWYDSDLEAMFVYSSSAWRQTALSVSSTTSPMNSVQFGAIMATEIGP